MCSAAAHVLWWKGEMHLWHGACSSSHSAYGSHRTSKCCCTRAVVKGWNAPCGTEPAPPPIQHTVPAPPPIQHTVPIAHQSAAAHVLWWKGEVHPVARSLLLLPFSIRFPLLLPFSIRFPSHIKVLLHTCCGERVKCTLWHGACSSSHSAYGSHRTSKCCCTRAVVKGWNAPCGTEPAPPPIQHTVPIAHQSPARDITHSPASIGLTRAPRSAAAPGKGPEVTGRGEEVSQSLARDFLPSQISIWYNYEVPPPPPPVYFRKSKPWAREFPPRKY